MRPHRTLIAWQRSVEYIKDIYQLTNSFPPEERFGLTSQFRRAVLSVALNIAEGAARQSIKEFIKFLFISEGSLSELDTLLEVSKLLERISEEEYLLFLDKNEKNSALVSGLRRSLERKDKNNKN